MALVEELERLAELHRTGAENKIAVMLESCNEEVTKVTRGAMVRFERHPEGCYVRRCSGATYGGG